MSRMLQGELIILGFIVVVVIPVVAYLTFARVGQRKQISERGIQSLGGKCPKCGGKLKPLDLFTGRSQMTQYKIGAARCNLCHHLEVFSEEP